MSSRFKFSKIALLSHSATILLLGLMAGFFATYSANVNLATLEFDGQTYALAQSAFNRNVRHPLFFVCFFGPTFLGFASLMLSWRRCGQAWWRWLAVVVGLYTLGIVLFTREVNLPLNALTESWTSTALPTNWQETRDAWNLANLWRACLSVALFVIGLQTFVARLRDGFANSSTANQPGCDGDQS